METQSTTTERTDFRRMDMMTVAPRFEQRNQGRVRRVEEVLALPVPEHDNILADRLLAKGQSLTLLGSGGIGKSRLVMQLAVSCILWRPFVGLRTHNGNLRWLILQAENSVRRVKEDLGALKRWAGGDWDKVNEQLFVDMLEGNGEVWGTEEMWKRVADSIARHEADVVCLDPLSAFTGLDLNHDGSMRAICRKMTEVCQGKDRERALVVLHHSLAGKVGAARAVGYERENFGRNSKVLQAWTRGQMNVAPGDPEDRSRLVLSCGKCSNGEPFGVYGIRLNPKTMIYEEDPSFEVEKWEEGLRAKARATDRWEAAVDLCETGMLRGELVQKIMNQTHFARAYAYRLIQTAESKGELTMENGRMRRTAKESDE